MKWMQWRDVVATALPFIESRRCVLRARSEKINSPGISMASRQRRARMRAALSTLFLRSQPATAPHKGSRTFTCVRSACVAMVLASVTSAHAVRQVIVGYWAGDSEHGAARPTPQEACEAVIANKNEAVKAGKLAGGYVLESCGTTASWVMAYKVLSDGGQYLWTNVTYISTRFGCPVNSMLIPQNGNCKCNAGFEEDPAGTSCAASSPPETAADRKCDAGLFAGNPILPATGEKYRSEVDWTDSGPAPLSLERTYRSNWASYIARPDTGLGAVWTHNHGARLMATPALAPTDIAIVMPDGSRRTFAKVGSSFWVANGSADRLEEGRGGGWTYRRADDDTSWAFDSAGKLQGKFDRNGWITAYWYDAAGRLSEVTNPFGRSLAFTYNNTGQLTAVTTPEARVIAYRYDSAGRLSSVVYPGGKARSFLYENAVFAQALRATPPPRPAPTSGSRAPSTTPWACRAPSPMRWAKPPRSSAMSWAGRR
ncbi:DUF6531 domain-containing protein [Variovorax guangxiensis]|uniref:DUF6531 domain-containing protein n=1 Tax=Variovorax guangxiensis TaxID=1775474 RepID=UPI00285F1550|nr:DUF6531 domain-containing protein [Variovorax guangxiensis]MDR6860073.1 YD repeat-containing protein [Variovorax guangxiensis]